MTSSDWSARLKRGRWLLQTGADVARCDPLLAADWSRAVRAIHSAFGWDVSQRVGELVLDVAREAPQTAKALSRALPAALAKVKTSRQLLMLDGLAVTLAQTSGRERLLLVLSAMPEALRVLGPEEFRDWCASLQSLEGDAKTMEAHLNAETDLGREFFDEAQRGVGLDSVRASLEHYILARCGRPLRIEEVPPQGNRLMFGCDGYRVYLPARVSDFGDERDVVSYRVRTAISCAYVEFGSFDLLETGVDVDNPDTHPLMRLVQDYPLPFAAKTLFERFERVRVTSLLVAKYPGLKRDVTLWKAGCSLNTEPVEESSSEVDNVLSGLDLLWLGRSCANPVAQRWFQEAKARLTGEPTVDATLALFREKAGELMAMAVVSEATGRATGGGFGDLALEARRPNERAFDGQLARIRARMGEEGIESSTEGVRAVMAGQGGAGDSSYAEMAAFLEANPPPDGGLVDPSYGDSLTQGEAGRVAHGNALAPQGGVLYREWDHEIDAYRRDWVRVVEHSIEGGDAGFAERTRSEHGQHILKLRKTFEALKPQEYERRRGEMHGDELDLDRVVSAWVARRSGDVPDERLYTAHRRNIRSVAVAFLLDLSSSTNEPARFGGKRIIDVEKEALMVTAEALEALGDDFAIFGFSGFSREEVAFYTAKEFGESYDARVQARIGGLAFKMENRDGAAIRHAGEKLLAHPANTKVLFLLSDGKPLDCGCSMYKDLYAQEDTRVALQELRRQGIKAFCITVDPKGSDYLSTLYGEGNYTVVDDVERLPLQLPQFYRRFAT